MGGKAAEFHRYVCWCGDSGCVKHHQYFKEDRDYVDLFGRPPEPWREPLGALRLTLAADDVDIDRAECEELVRILNAQAHP